MSYQGERCYDAAMAFNKWASVMYWVYGILVSLRQECIRAALLAQRDRKKLNAGELVMKHKQACRWLPNVIKPLLKGTSQGTLVPAKKKRNCHVPTTILKR